MQLSPNQKTFSGLSAAFAKSTLNLEHFEQNWWASEVICFRNYRLQKAGLLKWQKRPVSQHLWTVNMLKGAKHCLNLQGSIFVKFLDHSERKSDPEILFSSIWSIDTLCWHIDTRWQVSALSKRECLMKPIKMLLCYYLKIKKYVLIFFLYFQNLHKIWNTLKKKDEPWKLFVSKIVDSKQRGYLNAQKDPYQNTYGQSIC